MIFRILQALKAEKYRLPKVGTYTGAQLAAMLKERNAPPATIEVFEKRVAEIKIDPPRHILIAPPPQ